MVIKKHLLASFYIIELMKKVLVIVGPTSVGKTSFGVRCAKLFNGEVISGDSIQVYKGLDIGSAKVTKEETEGIKHHLIDIKEPFDNYSVKEFQEKGREIIDDISSRGELPIIVGGTGLYIKALLYDYVFFDEDEKDEQYDDLTNEELYSMLQKEDPKALDNIHINNRKRLVRALNIVRKHGKGISSIKEEQEHKPIYDIKIIGLTKDRDKLKEDINLRVDQMIKDGLVDEIKGLLDKGVTFDNQSMQAIGYKEFKDYFENTKTLEEVIEQIKINTRHFAKRQYTWFNNQMDMEWYDNKDKAIESIKDWYE